MGFLKQVYWSRLPFPPPGDLPDPWIQPISPALAGRFFITETPGKTSLIRRAYQFSYEYSPINNFTLSKVSRLAHRIPADLTIQCESASKVRTLDCICWEESQVGFFSGFTTLVSIEGRLPILSYRQIKETGTPPYFLCSHQRQ